MRLVDVVGIVPSLIFPAATATQLLALVRSRSAAGASAVTWSLFAVANICLSVYTEKYGEWQSIVGLLGSAAADVAIVGLILRYRAASQAS